jgi:hypothetical protein
VSNGDGEAAAAAPPALAEAWPRRVRGVPATDGVSHPAGVPAADRDDERWSGVANRAANSLSACGGGRGEGADAPTQKTVSGVGWQPAVSKSGTVFNAAHCATQRNATQRNATQRNATQRTAPHRTAPHRTAPHRTAPHRTAPQRNATHRTAPQRNATQRNATQRNAA